VLLKAWKWTKEHVWAVLAAAGGLLLAILLYLNRRNSISSVSDAVAVRGALKDIAAKEARARLLHEQGDAAKPEVERLESEIAASKRRVLEINNAEPLDNRSDDDVARLFTDAGF